MPDRTRERRPYDFLLAYVNDMLAELTLAQDRMTAADDKEQFDRMLRYWREIEKDLLQRCQVPVTILDVALHFAGQEDDIATWHDSIVLNCKAHKKLLAALISRAQRKRQAQSSTRKGAGRPAGRATEENAARIEPVLRKNLYLPAKEVREKLNDDSITDVAISRVRSRLKEIS